MRQADEMYLSQFSGTWFLTAAAPFVAATDANEIKDNRQQTTSSPGLDEIYPSVLRLLRMLSSETLIILVLSGYPLGPTIRLASRLRGERLNKTFDAISRDEIPKWIGVGDQPKNLETLLSLLIWSGIQPRDEWCKDMFAFLREEATILANRGMVNAAKHARLVDGLPYGEKLLSVKKHDQELMWSELAETSTGVCWFEWREGRGLEDAFEFSHTLSHKIAETDPLEDFEAIRFASEMMELVRTARLAMFKGEGPIKLQIPKPKSVSLQTKINGINWSEHW